MPEFQLLQNQMLRYRIAEATSTIRMKSLQKANNGEKKTARKLQGDEAALAAGLCSLKIPHFYYSYLL